MLFQFNCSTIVRIKTSFGCFGRWGRRWVWESESAFWNGPTSWKAPVWSFIGQMVLFLSEDFVYSLELPRTCHPGWVEMRALQENPIGRACNQFWQWLWQHFIYLSLCLFWSWEWMGNLGTLVLQWANGMVWTLPTNFPFNQQINRQSVNNTDTNSAALTAHRQNCVDELALRINW